jgi:acetylornithine deacetylase/succinyl-diaminopimelate desuccinylase-like protein
MRKNLRLTLLGYLIAIFALAGYAGRSSAASDQLTAREVSDAITRYRQGREAQILTDFVDLLSLPNDSINRADMNRNVDFITAMLDSRGFTFRTLRAGGAPYVYAELMQPGATETLLLYVHFDGQPVQAENWASPPFSPTLLDAPLPSGKPVDIDAVQGGFGPEWRLYARSAGDDKMPIIALLHTLDALQAQGIARSINLKLLLDGEEERGSPTLGKVMDANPGLFDADLLLFCDGPMHQSRQAQLVFGVRGSTSVDITTYGATRPLHSGHYGNWSPNPTMRLAYLLTSMRDEQGRILIDGYYDNVAALSGAERAAIDAMPDITETLKDELSVHTPEGRGARIEELVALPAVNVRGIKAGGVGAKGRNIIVPSATVSLNLRMVPNQQPARLRKLIEAHIQKQGFAITHEDPTPAFLRSNPRVARLDWHGEGSAGLRTPMDGEMAKRLIAVMRELEPDLILTPSMGGTLPLNDFAERLDTPIIVLPLANHDNNQHGRNENIRLQNLWDAMAVYGAVLATIGLR